MEDSTQTSLNNLPSNMNGFVAVVYWPTLHDITHGLFPDNTIDYYHNYNIVHILP